jgi:hypothetical protein
LTHVDAHPGGTFKPQLATVQFLASGTLALGVFLTGFVIHEPAPGDALMALLIAVWFGVGLKITRNTGPLLMMLIVLETGCLLSLTQMEDLDVGPAYLGVSSYLACTAVFYAAVIESRPDILPLIFKAWTAGAVATAMLGILGYFHAFPHADIFTRYDRAMGAFKDPNVFGPYLVAPALYLIHGILTGKTYHLPLRMISLLILALGVFLSFSRAAWALFVFSSFAMILFMLLKERTSAFRLKILVVALVGTIIMIAVLAIALQIPKVADLFSARSHLVQAYDGGHLGRFERHKLGFLMSMQHPLGIGPMVFSKIFPEDEHDIWLKMLTTYGWLGFVTYLTMIVWTISAGFKYLLRNRPWQPFLMIAWIVLVGHTAIASIIDTDHWRHFYLMLGVIWGCRALERNYQRNRQRLGAPNAQSAA